ncbi:zinc ribbon-containing protein [Salinicola avicenniae]|uniref:zinc ribbon-containing protein n=1 Tax=Salinicola avicenniae TaxID=2916836 RepID=UPI002072BB5A|nr:MULTISPECIES: zinc ribbon-containing protein [unclassified Salinicola]
MAEQHSPDSERSRLGDAYERVLARLKEGSGELSWESFQRELDEAVAFESEFEEFTKDEAALLRAWVERDMRDFRQFLAKGGEGVAAWLGIDLGVLSRRVSDALFSIADRTAIDRERFDDDLEAARADYTAGEVALPGRMSCVHCGAGVMLDHVARLEACHACGHRYFQRASGSNGEASSPSS